MFERVQTCSCKQSPSRAYIPTRNNTLTASFSWPWKKNRQIPSVFCFPSFLPPLHSPAPLPSPPPTPTVLFHAHALLFRSVVRPFYTPSFHPIRFLLLRISQTVILTFLKKCSEIPTRERERHPKDFSCNCTVKECFLHGCSVNLAVNFIPFQWNALRTALPLPTYAYHWFHSCVGRTF